jgi:hypothetical protein
MEAVSAITVDRRPRVKNAMAVVSVTTEGERPRVKNAAEAVFASMGRTDNIVKIVVAVEYVTTEGERPRVKNAVEVVEFVFTARSSIAALNANGSKGELISSF